MDNRVVMHLDMNSFFASVEQSYNPDLKGKPIVVTGSQQRTVILTASYEARKFGVKTGMMLYEAKRLCPEVIMVPADNRKYTHTSAQIMKMMLDYTPLVEVFSIDEAFLDVTHSLLPQRISYGYAIGHPETMKYRIQENTGFRVSMPQVEILAELQAVPTGRFTMFSEIDNIPENIDYSGMSGGPIFWSTSEHYGMLGIIYEGGKGAELSNKSIYVFGELATAEVIKEWIAQVPLR